MNWKSNNIQRITPKNGHAKANQKNPNAKDNHKKLKNLIDRDGFLAFFNSVPFFMHINVGAIYVGKYTHAPVFAYN